MACLPCGEDDGDSATAVEPLAAQIRSVSLLSATSANVCAPEAVVLLAQLSNVDVCR